MLYIEKRHEIITKKQNRDEYKIALNPFRHNLNNAYNTCNALLKKNWSILKFSEFYKALVVSFKIEQIFFIPTFSKPIYVLLNIA